MEIMQAKETVIKAGKELIAAGLIARTWGNISCRISDTQFVITPSGRAYETLTPEEIVLVNIEDLEYEGEIKPSSEKGIHAACYKLRPEINFVIHTHQVNASIVSALGMDINNVEGENATIVGNNVPIASYGLPGTKKLRKGVIDAITRSDAKAAVMSHHGAVCMGVDYDDAFNVAKRLEDICEQYVLDKYTSLTGTVADSLTAINDYVVDKFVKKPSTAPEFVPCKSERDGPVFNISVIDGDGSLLMNMGSLVTVFANNPRNLTWIVIDNGAYGSTGNQDTYAQVLDLVSVARGVGFVNSHNFKDINLKEFIESDDASFIVYNTEPGNSKAPIIDLDPVSIKKRFMNIM